MTDNILLIMPTRGRRWSAIAALASALQTAAQPQSVFCVVCQDDDDLERFHLETYDHRITGLSRPRMRFVEWVNTAVNHPHPRRAAWYAWLGDDVRFLTPGWDDLVRSHQELVVYGPDGIHDEKMATHPFIRAALPKALGYLLPSSLTHGCADTFIEALARELGSIAYDPRIKLEHLHPGAGKAAKDQTYLDADAVWDQDKKTMAEIILPTIPSLAKIVRDSLK